MDPRANQPPSERQHHGHQHHHPPVSPHPHKARQDQDDPIAEYVEWTEHRYTPGYYLGGRLPPTIRALQRGGLSGRMFGSLLLTLGVADLLAIAIFWRGGSYDTAVILGFVGLLSALAGVRAFRGHSTQRER